MIHHHPDCVGDDMRSLGEEFGENLRLRLAEDGTVGRKEAEGQSRQVIPRSELLTSGNL